MGEERVALERFDHGDDAIVAANAQVIALGNVVGQNYSRALPDTRENGQQNSAFEGLSFINDDKGVVERAATDMGQWQNFDQAAVDDFINHRLAHERAQSIEDRLGPRRHLLALAAG